MTRHRQEDDHTEESGEYLAGVLLGFVCGMAAGAALGLLFAPARGSDARAWVAVQGRAAGRRTAAFLNQRDAIAIVSRDGVRGLIEVLRGARAAQRVS
jgi:hypothetical protein